MIRKKSWNKYSSSESDLDYLDDLDNNDSSNNSLDLNDNFFKLKSTMDLKKEKLNLIKEDIKIFYNFQDKKKSKGEIDNINSLVK
jgi:hypothetical protein